MASRRYEVFDGYDLIVDVNGVEFGVSSHVVRMISPILGGQIVPCYTSDGIPFRLTLEDPDDKGFLHVMNVAHYNSDMLPNSFSIVDTQQLASLCTKYNLYRFFKQHNILWRKCRQGVSTLSMKCEDRINVGWNFQLESVFTSAWSELLNTAHLAWDEALFSTHIDVEKIIANKEVAMLGYRISKPLPEQVHAELERSLTERHEALNSSDVYQVLFDCMLLKDGEAAPFRPCYKFRENNWGRLILNAHEDKHIDGKLPIALQSSRLPELEYYPLCGAAWLQSWMRKLNFKSCHCHCENRIWGLVRQRFLEVKVELPKALQEHFKKARVASKRARDVLDIYEDV